MKQEKFYVYGVMPKQTNNQHEIKGLFDENIVIKDFENVQIITSVYPQTEDVPVLSSRQNMVTHQKTIEYFFEKDTIIPTQFGTLMTEKEINIFLNNNTENLNKTLIDFQQKGEMVLKGFWKDMPAIFKNIAENTTKITQYKERMQNGTITPSQNNLIEIGQMVEEELLNQKQKIENFFYEKLAPMTKKIIKNQLLNESMCINMVFLIDRKDENIFDEKIQRLTDELDKEIKFQFFAIAAPIHFIQIETN